MEAGEGHGPRKEFFFLAGQDMAGLQQQGSGHAPGGSGRESGSGASEQQQQPLWTYNRTAGAFWYNTQLQQGPELVAAYSFAGWLLGQCVTNRASLGLALPPVLFEQLLKGDAFKVRRHTLHLHTGSHTHSRAAV